MDVKSLADKIQENISKVIIGKENEIRLLLTCIIAGGHALMEDVPGTGKTVMARSLAASIDCGFNRIQFTPDLLPGDVTGLNVYDMQKAEFVFKPGPVFTNVLLADEINRATPRTQSALLECMEEKQVTTDGVTRKLSEPFLVIATQNPIETQGTFPLPEAQLDRFLMKLSLGKLSCEDAVRVLERFVKADPLSELQPVCQAADILQAREACKDCLVSPEIMDYIARLCLNTHEAANVALGVSPRGMLALMRCCRAFALISGRDFVTPDDVSDTAKNAIKEAMAKTDVPTEDAKVQETDE